MLKRFGVKHMDIEKRIENKNKEIKLYKVYDIFIRSILTLIGTITSISILMFLNNVFNVSMLSCIIMSIIIPQLYSIIINNSLKGLDNKIKNKEYELSALEDKKSLEQLITKQNTNEIKQIEFRFEGLSNERKIELLNYIKELIPETSYHKYLNDLDNLDTINLNDFNEENIYTKKRIK